MISDQMIANSVKKKYYAVVNGIVKKDEDTINCPIGQLNEDDIERRVLEDGIASITHYKVIERFDNATVKATLVEILLETGKTHQIRVHFKSIGHILIGDELYGRNHELIGRQALHAFYLKLKGLDGEMQTHKIDLPDDMKKLIEKLRG